MLRKKKIVLLEHEQAALSQMESALTAEGYAVYAAMTGTEGLRLINSESPDMIILNPVLPALSGYALMDILQAKGSEVPILVITSELNMLDHLAQQAVAGLLIKPVDPSKLVIHVDAIIKLSEAGRRLKGPVEDVWSRDRRVIDEDSIRVQPEKPETENEASPPSEPLETTLPETPEASEGGKKPLALIVDDEPDMLSLLTDLFEHSGFETAAAADGHEALNLAQRLMPNIIILDIMLPKMDGYQVCRMLKFNEKYHGIPVLVLTARHAPQDRYIAEAAGADGFVQKPFDSKVLMDEVKRIIGQAAYGTTDKPAQADGADR